MTDVGDIFDNDFHGDVVDTPKEGIEQHKKRECLNGAMDKGKGYLLGSKWTHETVDKASDETINKKYAGYIQCKFNEKGEKTANVLGKDVIKLYSKGISWFANIRDAKKLRQDIEDDPIIKDQMADLGCLLVYTLGDYLWPFSIAAHTADNLDFGNKPENEGYESD